MSDKETQDHDKSEPWFEAHPQGKTMMFSSPTRDPHEADKTRDLKNTTDKSTPDDWCQTTAPRPDDWSTNRVKEDTDESRNETNGRRSKANRTMTIVAIFVLAIALAIGALLVFSPSSSNQHQSTAMKAAPVKVQKSASPLQQGEFANGVGNTQIKLDYRASENRFDLEIKSANEKRLRYVCEPTQ